VVWAAVGAARTEVKSVRRGGVVNALRHAVEVGPEHVSGWLEYPYEFTEYRFPPTIQPPPLDPPVMSHPMPIVAGLAELPLVCSGELHVHSRSPVNGGAAG